MSKRPKKPDLNQLAKFIVDDATDETQPEEINENPLMNAFNRIKVVRGMILKKQWFK